MAEIAKGNWSFRDPGDEIPDGSVIVGGNFRQLVPDTVILAGKRLTIRGGNWINVKPDPNWTVEGGNWAQISCCSHLHPEWIKRGLPECPEDCEIEGEHEHAPEHPEWVDKGLPECPEDCEHREGDEKQWVDVDEAEFRQHRADAREFTPDTPTLRITKDVDEDGIETQHLQKYVFVHRDKVMGHNRPRTKAVTR